MENISSDRAPINIDQIYEIFVLTVGSTKGAAGMVLWAWALYSHMSWDLWHQASITYMAMVWLMVVAGTRALFWLNQRLVNGWGRFSLDPKSDTILITGGSNGLGLLLSAMFSTNGFTTVNLDIDKPSIDIAKSTYIHCDIGDYDGIAKALDSLPHPPSVLINCAGTVSNSMGPLTKLRSEHLAKVIQTNYMGSVWTTHCLLRRNPGTKMVVAISSSTALASPAFAGIYASSKAAVLSFFHSLRHELSSGAFPGVSQPPRVLCVVSGQLDTAMFREVATPSPFWAPVARSVDVATTIYQAVTAGQQGELLMPTYTRLLPYILVLPQSIVDLCRWIIGIDLAAKTRT